MSKTPETVTEIHRLTPEAYRQLEQKLPAASLPRDGVAAAYSLGIQHVLSVLREGFVIRA